MSGYVHIIFWNLICVQSFLIPLFPLDFIICFYSHIGHHVNYKWSTNSVFIDLRKSSEVKLICNLA